ncbi:MAG TPA: hypothetical protein VEY71_10575 [Chitinophagales bacterium]|nr:hypothetical protein [Chitinophagales bacterium]
MDDFKRQHADTTPSDPYFSEKLIARLDAEGYRYCHGMSERTSTFLHEATGEFIPRERLDALVKLYNGEDVPIAEWCDAFANSCNDRQRRIDHMRMLLRSNRNILETGKGDGAAFQHE